MANTCNFYTFYVCPNSRCIYLQCGCMYFPVSVWLAVVAFNCLIDATPLPEDRAKTPKEVQKINKWLGIDKNSDILKDILEVANAFAKIEENKQTIEGIY